MICICITVFFCNYFKKSRKSMILMIMLDIWLSLPVKLSCLSVSVRMKSFQIHGARVFNTLPKSLRNLKKTSTEEFKAKLDKFLETIPDEPKLPGYIPTGCNQTSAGPSNSMIDQSRNIRCRRPG